MTQLTNLVAKKKHVIWDWNGTLIDDVNHAITIMNQMLQARNLQCIDRFRYRQIFEFPVVNYYKSLGFNFEKESFEKLSNEFVEMYMKGFKHCPLSPHANRVLEEIAQLGIAQSILSASDQRSLNEMVVHFQIEKYFLSIQGIENKYAASKVEKGKALLKSSNFSKLETVLVGDTEHDLEVGKALGIEVILVGHGHQCPLRLKKCHEQVLH